MISKFIYTCKLAGSTVDVYLTDLDHVKELYDEGAIVSCRRFKGVL